MEFRLGDYISKDVYFSSLLNADLPEINGDLDGDVLKLRYPKDYYSDLTYPQNFQQVLTLNTQNYANETAKNDLRNLEITSLFLAFSLLIELARKLQPILRHK